MGTRITSDHPARHETLVSAYIARGAHILVQNYLPIPPLVI
jgi:hypothetical protein